MKSVKWFDTHKNKSNGVNLASHIKSAPENSIITIAVQDEGSEYFKYAREAIRKIGGLRSTLTYRSSYALLGYKGRLGENWVAEVYNEPGKGPSVIRKILQLNNGKAPVTMKGKALLNNKCRPAIANIIRHLSRFFNDAGF